MTEQIIQERNSKFLSNPPINLTLKNDTNKLTLRKKTVDKIILEKRMNFYILHEENKLKLSNSNQKNTINLFSLNISNELKYPQTITKLINNNDSSEIFKYLYEIYNNENYNENNLKYGLYLLNQKLINNENRNIDIENILNNNFIDIINKLLLYFKSDKNNYEKDKTLIYTILLILINFTFYANEHQISFLINDNFLEYFVYLLKICNEDNIIEDIFDILSNLCAINYNLSSIIFNYNNNILLDIINDYCISSLKAQKSNILNKSLFIYYNYLDTIAEDENNEINVNFNILESIYNILSNLIDIKNCFSKCILGINYIYKIIFQKNYIKLFIDNILNNESDSFYSSLFGYNYCINEGIQNIEPFTNIIKNILYIYNNYNTNDYNGVKIIEKRIYSLNEDNNIIDFFYMLLQNPLKNQSKIFILEVLNELSITNFYTFLQECSSDIIGYIIKIISNFDFKIKKFALRIIKNLTDKGELKVISSIGSKGINNQIILCLDPINSCINDSEIILLCLGILENLFKMGMFIKNISGHNNFIEDFGVLGGKELLEKLLGNPHKEVYLKSENIINKFFNENDNQ
jgi:hypothetical protein